MSTKPNITPSSNSPKLWTSNWGEDEYGLWMSFTYKNIEQRFRWIKPGKFMMGSPEDELERRESELLHEVVLTKGFWLADTACTQELWEAVVGSNPSESKGKQKPVQNINWHDCHKFINKINKIIPELNLCLPSEAQWEYACRAGTQTPFNFGDNITTEQVNYHGKSPYTNGLEGTYPRETVEVKSLPCNNWGLYEMHGNVYEWCYDWYGDYNTENVINPVGSISGKYKVVRGGNWLTYVRNTRSAYRNEFSPGNRNRNIGFRFV